MRILPAILLITPIVLLPGFERTDRPAPVKVSGVVVDAESLAPLAHVDVRWQTTSARSDAAGRYEIVLPAGIRQLKIAAAGRPAVTKLVILDGSRVDARQDVLLPAKQGRAKVWILDRGSLLGQHGKALAADAGAVSNVAFADEFGNFDQFQPLGTGGARAWSPAWIDAESIVYGQDRVIHRTENMKLLGVYRFRAGASQSEQIIAGVPASFVCKSPRSGDLAIANQKELYVGPPARRIFSLGANDGRILSVAWASDGRIYVTIEDRLTVDDRRSIGRSRIASVDPDGSGLRPNWMADEKASFRYPLADGDGILFSRFALNGANRSILRFSLTDRKVEERVPSALRPVHFDARTRRMYSIDGQSLHLHDLQSGTDLVIVTAVESADRRN